MRIKLIFELFNTLQLPISYQHHIQGLIYELINDSDMISFLHNEGFGDIKKFKLFTFSSVKGEFEFHKETKQIVFKDFIELHISSVYQPFLELLIKQLLNNEDIMLANQKIKLATFSYEKAKSIKPVMKIKMLSPITVHETIEKKTLYFSPFDQKFFKAIESNAESKYLSFYKTYPQTKLNIKALEVDQNSQVIIKFKGIVIIGYFGVYELKGSKKLLEFLYYTGIGSKNSVGFGMFEFI